MKTILLLCLTMGLCGCYSKRLSAIQDDIAELQSRESVLHNENQFQDNRMMKIEKEQWHQDLAIGSLEMKYQQLNKKVK